MCAFCLFSSFQEISLQKGRPLVPTIHFFLSDNGEWKPISELNLINFCLNSIYVCHLCEIRYGCIRRAHVVMLTRFWDREMRIAFRASGLWFTCFLINDDRNCTECAALAVCARVCVCSMCHFQMGSSIWWWHGNDAMPFSLKGKVAGTNAIEKKKRTESENCSAWIKDIPTISKHTIFISISFDCGRLSVNIRLSNESEIRKMKQGYFIISRPKKRNIACNCLRAYRTENFPFDETRGHIEAAKNTHKHRQTHAMGHTYAN